MTISVLIRTTKERGAQIRGPGGTITKVPKDSEQLFHVWGEGILTIRETK